MVLLGTSLKEGLLCLEERYIENVIAFSFVFLFVSLITHFYSCFLLSGGKFKKKRYADQNEYLFIKCLKSESFILPLSGLE